MMMSREPALRRELNSTLVQSFALISYLQAQAKLTFGTVCSIFFDSGAPLASADTL